MPKSNGMYDIVGNWKMHKTPEEARALAAEILPEVEGLNRVEITLCVPFVSLEGVSKTLNRHVRGKVHLGAQNLHPASEGAFTGEISPPMLRASHVKYVIVGHSERRELFGETDSFIREKFLATLENLLRPILCVGETLEEREKGKTQNTLERQLKSALSGLKEDQARRILIAYEPRWAIGTGQAATPSQAQESHQFIRQKLSERFTDSIADSTALLYGGSVQTTNAEGLLSQNDIDGALIGGACLKAKDFIRIAQIAQKLTN